MEATTQGGGGGGGGARLINGGEDRAISPPARARARGRATCRGKLFGVEGEATNTSISRMTQSQSMWKKVPVVYYLTRNGLLEHPHCLEVSHSAHLPLRLHDVTDRLAVLRGRAMPSRYSWSCKRSYKNGYVWNDLSENDIVCPLNATECVLKGSELLLPAPPPPAPQERLVLQQLPTSCLEKQEQQHNTRTMHPVVVEQAQSIKRESEEEEDDDEDDECNRNEKVSYTSSTTPHSLSSRGVSTDDRHSPPFTISPDDNVAPVAHKAVAENQQGRRQGNLTSEDFKHRDSPVVPSGRNSNGSSSSSSSSSILLQLIACGGSVVAKGRKPMSMPCLKQQMSLHNHNHRGPPYNKYSATTATSGAAKEEPKVKDDNDQVIIRYMSENPRFGNLQSEEKEYFSGSILDAINTNTRNHDHEGASVVEHVLKKSSSYNEERSSNARLGSAAAGGGGEKGKKEKGAVKAKCIPRKKKHNSSSRQTVQRE
ncbi:hypothetical protein Dimus_017959 [Dionaea muscipula]